MKAEKEVERNKQNKDKEIQALEKRGGGKDSSPIALERISM